MGLSMELEARSQQVEKTVVEGIKALCDFGSTLIAIACNTTQYFSGRCEEVCACYGCKYVTMVECLERVLSERGASEFDFLGWFCVGIGQLERLHQTQGSL